MKLNITAQLDNRSFMKPEFFIKRIVYNIINNSSKIIKYEENTKLKELFEILIEAHPECSIININNENHLKISYLEGQKIIKIYEIEIPNILKTTAEQIITLITNLN